MDLKNIKNAYQCKVHLETGKYSFVIDKKVYNGKLSECDDEVAFYIINNFNQINYEFDLDKESEIYEYSIWNGYDYDMSSHSMIYSKLFFTQEEFTKIVIKYSKESDWETASNIAKNDKRFFRMTFGQSTNIRLLNITQSFVNGDYSDAKYIDEDEESEINEILKKYF